MTNVEDLKWVLSNINDLIVTAESSILRSPPKIRLSAQQILDLYNLKDLYTKQLADLEKPTPAPKKAPVRKTKPTEE